MWSHPAGRVCRGTELDPLYVYVIVRRFEAATGNQAVLVETGETFEALATQGAGTGVGLRPAPAVADVAVRAAEEQEAATGQARGCLHCGGHRFESPLVFLCHRIARQPRAFGS
jgi:hypothetical protein